MISKKMYRVKTDISPKTLLSLLEAETKQSDNEIMIDTGSEVSLFMNFHTFVGKIWDDGFRVSATGYDKDKDYIMRLNNVILNGQLSCEDGKTIILIKAECGKFDIFWTSVSLFMIIAMFMLIRYVGLSVETLISMIFLIMVGIVFIKSFEWGLKFAMKQLLRVLHCEYAEIEEVKVR